MDSQGYNQNGVLKMNEISNRLDTLKDAKEYIEKLENLLRKVFPEKSGHYFISYELGNKDNNGLPDKIEICPAYGCDFSVVYEKTDRVIGGMGS